MKEKYTLFTLFLKTITIMIVIEELNNCSSSVEYTDYEAYRKSRQEKIKIIKEK